MKLSKYNNIFGNFDRALLISVILLVCLGLIAIYSIAISKEAADYIFLKKQLIAFFIGIVMLVFFAFIDYQNFKRYGLMFYGSVMLLLVLVLFFGTTIRGTTGWFSYFGFNFQPAELAKIALVAVLAWYFSKYLRESFKFSFIAFSFLLTLIIALPVVLQPDLGSASILFGTWFLMMLFTRIKKSHLVIILVILTILGLIAWGFVLEDYQKERILVFVNPNTDPLGKGYNVAQSIIAIGAGKFFGSGLGFGSQSQLKFLPEARTDFVLAVIGEELGLIGISLILLFWLLFFYRMMLIAKKARDDFGAFLVIGIISIFFIQFFINIGMNVGIMPVTGITLPFLSYGGSSLIISLLMVGIAESVRRRSF